MACIIGVDPSINSTGVCINNGPGQYIYYIIPSKMTKKMDRFQHDVVKLIPYIKGDHKDMEYTDKEIVKTQNLYNIAEKISYIIDEYKPDHIIMEGVSYGSTSGSALVDLSGLNYILRYIYKSKGVPFTIVSPTSLKKFVCANGQAEKGLIIESWKMMDKNINNITEIKVDDLADAFFLSNYPH